MQTSNTSIWGYHCLEEVEFLKILNQYRLPSDAIHHRVFFHFPCPPCLQIPWIDSRILASEAIGFRFNSRLGPIFYLGKTDSGKMCDFNWQHLYLWIKSRHLISQWYILELGKWENSILWRVRQAIGPAVQESPAHVFCSLFCKE